MDKKYNRRKKFYRKSNRRKSKKRKNRKKTNRKRNLRGGAAATTAGIGDETPFLVPSPTPEKPSLDAPGAADAAEARLVLASGTADNRLERCKTAETLQMLVNIATEDPSIENDIIEGIRGIVIEKLELERRSSYLTEQMKGNSPFIPIGTRTAQERGSAARWLGNVVVDEDAGTGLGRSLSVPGGRQVTHSDSLRKTFSSPPRVSGQADLSEELRLGPPGLVRAEGGGLETGADEAVEAFDHLTFITNFLPNWERASTVAGRTSPKPVPQTTQKDDQRHRERDPFTSNISTILSNVKSLVLDEEDKLEAKTYLIKGLEDLYTYFEHLPDSFVLWWLRGNRPNYFTTYAETLNIDQNGKPK